MLSPYLLLLPTVLFAAGEWPQWGGPHRNFQSDATGLADSWPATGPKILWSRDLGEGYSGISVDGGRLFTMYRRANNEVVIAMDAKSGKTVWERVNNASPRSRMGLENGPGPHVTPLVTGDLVYTVGILGLLQALDKKTGKVVWSHELWNEFGGDRVGRGYGNSPMAYRDLIIVPVGGKGHSVMAFRQKDGSVAWQAQDFGNAFSSPI